MISTVLIANRGAIATRIIRTLKKMGIRSVAIYSDADKESLHVLEADQAVYLGDGPASETYLNFDKVLNAAKDTHSQAIHPGYGFLSENTDFVDACEKSGIAFIGPTTEQMQLFGLKHKAREAALAAGVPLVPGSDLLQDLNQAITTANNIGYPVMLKSTAGGGGIGMQVCHSENELVSAWDTVKRLSENYFANDGVFLEKYIARARHLEVQVFGNGQGDVVSFGERDCSAQRRNQKVIEETPAPNLDESIRTSLHQTAENLLASVHYRNAGTVEFIYDIDTKDFYFLEVNTRLQVEHGVTEQVWGIDLVELMVNQAAGNSPNLSDIKNALTPKGHAIQARVYAENTNANHQPSAGLLSQVSWPSDGSLRIDTWVTSGVEVSSLYDPMLAKVISYANTREQAIASLNHALVETNIYGIETNVSYCREIINHALFEKGELETRSLNEISASYSTMDVLKAGTQTTIQDYPGRQGFWDIGVPPSGPMDSLSFQLGNRLLGNESDCAGLEITVNGPTLQFNTAISFVMTGALTNAKLNDSAIEFYKVYDVLPGDILETGKIIKDGVRAYLLLSGGIDCPDYLGSKSTFTLGEFGGHSGRALKAGDVLQVNPTQPTNKFNQLSQKLWPTISNQWQLRVIYGPHGAPEFFTPEDIEEFFSSEWKVHYNSSRTGVRLIGPKPKWARETGGEAGLHPSNIHDNAYAFGTVDFTGDMPVILGPDGPSLGGFVCPATVIKADLWKLGQLRPGDCIKFIPVSIEQANHHSADQLKAVTELATTDIEVAPTSEQTLINPIVHKSNFGNESVVCRVAGDQFLLIEIGELTLSIERRFKVHMLMLELQKLNINGVLELTPGIRSLQVHYLSDTISLTNLLNRVDQALSELSDLDISKQTVPSRIVHLPLSWDDVACQEAIDKYTQSVRPNAPWCPSNLEFIRRINGLASVDEVKDILFSAAYLVMGLGDVYLGAPVATPVNPAQRLVTTKYNPARTWTAENSVGIGGAYLCIYGMEGPGGYQFVGRTLQMWNRYRKTKEFNKPWLLRFFDQIKFYPVSHDELATIRERFPLGQYPIKIEETEFSLEAYEKLLSEQESTIDSFYEKRTQAFDEELENWKRNGLLTYEAEEQIEKINQDDYPDNAELIESPVSGSVWNCMVKKGDKVSKGQTLMVLESMKMEIDVVSNADGIVGDILKSQGQMIAAGDVLVWLENNSEAGA